ncbi:F-type H+-transporting ATPase subunit b [Litorimonas taeanensis]|uniref:ATP synthase subunit b n=1 Tax=Litorimonas taeanensis TaxID=568099 RepID=A0A420WJ61_9PROT|nr:F0F1 ATP synthase subunit B' [Litorimonas taeanensis]RKQ70969.1 F-type H+-transporting ATPase subunit b [Litorimonas taeanensis]
MAAETHHSDVAEHAASGGLPQFDFSTWGNQIFWLIIVFGILYFVLSKFILPKLADGIVERKDRISDDLDSASRMQAEAEEAEKAYHQKLNDARAKAHNVAEATRQSINDELSSEIAAADLQAAKEAEAAETRIAGLREKALANVETIASETAIEIVKALTNKTTTAAQLRAAMK